MQAKAQNIYVTLCCKDRSWSISLDERIKKINYVVRGWINYFRIANMKKKITKIDKSLRNRIRVIIWKQWKKIERRERALEKLGVNKEKEHNVACTRKGYKAVCKTTWIKFAINNERLINSTETQNFCAIFV